MVSDLQEQSLPTEANPSRLNLRLLASLTTQISLAGRDRKPTLLIGDHESDQTRVLRR
jgi:hypothetical protein